MCILEAVIGQLYLVVQVAWLVGVHVSQSMLKKSEQGKGAGHKDFEL